MSDTDKVPKWLKSLPLAPEYSPTETEFADPIAFISRVEREAAAFGICKIVPPLPKPSKKFVLSNLSRSLATTADNPPSAAAGADAAGLFTTRHQELGTARGRAHHHKQQVWQSGEFYTLEQFESKSKAFQRSQLGHCKEATPLLVESLFWKAAAEKPIYIEYANDVPGSGFSAPEEPYLYRKRRRKLPEQGRSLAEEGTAGWKLSNSPWNLQAIARAPGSLTRFMPDEVPGVTSPMVYIGMLFSWFAWHVEDHELHSLNFLHMGAPKTWYAVPGEYAGMMEEVVRVEGYGGDLDRLGAFTMLGEKTTLLSPEVIVKSGVPCCRLVQHPGEFVVTFPRAYHVGFSHGFNCGEAANFATPQWLAVAKEAAVRRAAMNHLPMLSHQQLLYMLTVSFVCRVPRALLSGVRSSRLSDRKREERETLVKKAFLHDVMNENKLLQNILQKDSTTSVVLWEPDLLPIQSSLPHSVSSCLPVGLQGSVSSGDEGSKMAPQVPKEYHLGNSKENQSCELVDNPASILYHTHSDLDRNASHADSISTTELTEFLDAEEDELPFGLNIDSGTLACVACGILGYPFMVIIQPSEAATTELFPMVTENSHHNSSKSISMYVSSQLTSTCHKFGSETPSAQSDFACDVKGKGAKVKLSNSSGLEGSMNVKTNSACEEPSNAITIAVKPSSEVCNLDCEPATTSIMERKKFSRPRIFCLQHALEVEDLLHDKGGAHVLIICHSDYLKIKAYTPSIVEQVDMGFNIIDVPLMNASQSDLNLINIAIDDGEYEEHGEDWTSKLGVNLRYCMKLREQTTSKQVNLTLALGKIFSDPFSLSSLSTLKWHSRRSRTPYKVVGVSIAKSQTERNLEKSNRAERENFSREVKDYDDCREKQSVTAGSHRGCIVSERISVDGNDDNQTSHSPCSQNTSDKVEVEHAKGLVTVPIFAAENIEVHEGRWFPLRVGRAAEVTDLRKCECLPSPAESSGIVQRMSSSAELPTSKFVVPKSVDSQPNLLQPEAMSSEDQQETESINGVNLEQKADNYVALGNEPTSAGTDVEKGTEVCDENNVQQRSPGYSRSVLIQEPTYPVAVACTRDLQDIPVSDGPEGRTDLGNNDQSHVPVVSHDSSAEDESTSNEVHMEITADHESRSEDQLVNKTLITDSSTRLHSVSATEKFLVDVIQNRPSNVEVLVVDAMDPCGTPQVENPAAEHNLDGKVSNSQLEVQQFTDIWMITSDDVQQGTLPSTGTKTDTDANRLETPLDDEKCAVISVNPATAFVGESSGAGDTKGKEELVESCSKKLNSACLIQYVRQRKRKRDEVTAEGRHKRSGTDACPDKEDKGLTKDHRTYCGFIRGPCEGLRPRAGRTEAAPQSRGSGTFEQEKTVTTGRTLAEGLGPRTGSAVTAPEVRGSQKSELEKTVIKKKSSAEGNVEDSFECDIEGCRMKFWRKRELQLHMQSRCIYRGCRKRFKSHKDLMCHLRVHEDERPYKCPWRGCRMSFKWDWAKTEHFRIHTGERPYECKVAGCGLTFRYVSDFSRHRRKTGHYVKSTDH